MPRKKLSSPQAFASAFNKHQTEFKNPKEKINSNLMSLTLIGVDSKGKLKQERIQIPRWRIDSLKIMFTHNQKITINIGELKRQAMEQQQKQKPKHKQQQK